MKLVFSFLDNVIELENDKSFSLEVENKLYFYRIVNILAKISNGELLEEFCSFQNGEEINLSSKIMVIIDYFNIDNIFKTYHNNIIKYIYSNINDDIKNEIIDKYILASKSFNKCLVDIDLPLTVQNELLFENILKFMKIDVQIKDDLLDNLLLIIDVEKELKINRLLIFINLKQYLNKEEIEELYKYSIYNEVNILLIDSTYNKEIFNYENKLYIDRDLEEYMIK